MKTYTTHKQIIRNINLYLLFGIYPTDNNILSIYKELQDTFDDLIKKVVDKDGMYVAYGKPNKDYTDAYIFHVIIDNIVWLDEFLVYKLFENKYNLSYEIVEGLSYWYLKDKLNLESTTEVYVNRM